MNVCMVNDTSDDPNWGARATSFALRDLVESAGSRIDSILYQYRIGIPQLDDVETEDGQAFFTSPSDIVDVAPRSWEEFEWCARSVMKGVFFQEIRRAIDRCDVVLINGEGCIYDRTRQSRMIFFIAYLSKMVFRKVTALVNHSIVLNDPVLVDIAQHVYPMLDDVVFREPDSAAACPGIAGRVAADAAYMCSPVLYKRGEEGRALAVGLSDGVCDATRFNPARPYVCVGGGSVYFRDLKPGFDPIPGFVKLCRRLLEEVGQVLLTASSEKDMRILDPVSKALNLPVLEASIPVQQAVTALGNAEVYIGARWHPSIFAHSGGVPVVALSAYTPKMEAFMKQAGMASTRFDPFSIESQVDDIIASVKECLGGGEPLREELRAGASRLRLLARENVSALTQYSCSA